MWLASWSISKPANVRSLEIDHVHLMVKKSGVHTYSNDATPLGGGSPLCYLVDTAKTGLVFHNLLQMCERKALFAENPLSWAVENDRD